jgi:hypothetical protein
MIVSALQDHVEKLALWLSSIVLSYVIVSGIWELYCKWDHVSSHKDLVVQNVIQSCQTLSMIAIAVLGFHEYTGTHMFHTLRNWRGAK